MGYTRYSLDSTKNLIYKVKQYTREISKNMEREIQSKIINPLISGWYSEEGVIYVKGIEANFTAITSELAVAANEVIKSITDSYDNWLRRAKRSSDEEEAEVASRYWYISFNPSNQTKTSTPISVDKDNKAISYRYTSGGDRREFGYLRSEEIKIKLDTTGLTASKTGGEIEIGIDSNKIDEVISNISSIFNGYETTISSYQNQLSNSAYYMGYESGMSRAVSEYYNKMVKILNRLKNYMSTGTDGCTGVSTKLYDVEERYGTTIVHKIANDIEVDFNDI